MHSTQSNFNKVKESTFGGNSFDDREDASESQQTKKILMSHFGRLFDGKSKMSESQE
jgi:hypothetical protein